MNAQVINSQYDKSSKLAWKYFLSPQGLDILVSKNNLTPQTYSYGLKIFKNKKLSTTLK
jgi:hypothetical protein